MALKCHFGLEIKLLIRKVSTNTPLRTWDKKSYRRWTFLPKRMTSGTIVWWDWYYSFQELRSVDPRHLWIKEITYTEEEYFLQRLSE